MFLRLYKRRFLRSWMTKIYILYSFSIAKLRKKKKNSRWCWRWFATPLLLFSFWLSRSSPSPLPTAVASLNYHPKPADSSGRLRRRAEKPTAMTPSALVGPSWLLDPMAIGITDIRWLFFFPPLQHIAFYPIKKSFFFFIILLNLIIYIF